MLFLSLFMTTTSKFSFAELPPKNIFDWWNRQIVFKISTVMNIPATFQKYLSFYLFATCIKTSGAIHISPGLNPISTLIVSVSYLSSFISSSSSLRLLFALFSPHFLPHVLHSAFYNWQDTADFADASKVFFFHWLNIFISLSFFSQRVLIISEIYAFVRFNFHY